MPTPSPPSSSSSSSDEEEEEAAAAECPTCSNLDPFYLRADALRLPTRAVAQSADNGCPACALLRDGFARFGRRLSDEPATDEGESSTILYISRKDEGGCLDVDLMDADSNCLLTLQFYSLAGDPMPWKSIGAQTHISGDTESAASLSRIQEWLQRCITSHTSCNTRTTSRLPRRVLDLGDGEPASIKLYESNGEVDGIYACLSHCWGGLQPLQTKTSSLQDRKNGISWQDIPRTFQDAITVCRSLKIRYLWIDSLCIIQDSPDDWAQESSQMAAIYENAFLTIAATGAENGTRGCFTKHPHETHELSGTTATGETYRCFVRRPLQHYRAVLRGGVTKGYPLMDRAWVFQERLLSARFLHFGTSELFWECRASSICECSSYRDNSKNRWTRSLLNSQKSTSAALRGWRHVVVRYTRLRLSFESDRLPALAGAAQQFRAAVGTTVTGDYLAGIWANDLLWSLLWKAESIPTKRWAVTPPRPTRGRAPSWSWSSIEGTIIFFSDSTVYFESDDAYAASAPPLVQHYELLRQPRSINAFGVVETGGELVLKGALRALVVRYSPARAKLQKVHPDTTLAGYALYASSSDNASGNKPLTVLNPDYPLDQDPDLEADLKAGGIRVQALRMASVVHAGRFWEWALVLRRVGSDEEGGKWQRIGLVRYEHVVQSGGSGGGENSIFRQDAVEGVVRIV